jgi:hypothetical protein
VNSDHAPVLLLTFILSGLINLVQKGGGRKFEHVSAVPGRHYALFFLLGMGGLANACQNLAGKTFFRGQLLAFLVPFGSVCLLEYKNMLLYYCILILLEFVCVLFAHPFLYLNILR